MAKTTPIKIKPMAKYFLAFSRSVDYKRPVIFVKKDFPSLSVQGNTSKLWGTPGSQQGHQNLSQLEDFPSILVLITWNLGNCPLVTVTRARKNDSF